MRQYELVERVKSYDPNADEEALNRAYIFAMKMHSAKFRRMFILFRIEQRTYAKQLMSAGKSRLTSFFRRMPAAMKLSLRSRRFWNC